MTLQPVRERRGVVRPPAPIEIVLLGLPPSDNNAYRSGDGGRRYLATTAENWKAAVVSAWFEQAGRRRRELVDAEYEVEIKFFLNLRTIKEGRMKRWDVSSHQKLTLDAIASAIGSDDANCLRLVVAKNQAKNGSQTQVEVRLRPA